MKVREIYYSHFKVGLAVDDIKTVQDNAMLSRLAMQVNLNLDVEKMLPGSHVHVGLVIFSFKYTSSNLVTTRKQA
jgi:hypothetical protein